MCRTRGLNRKSKRCDDPDMPPLTFPSSDAIAAFIVHSTFYCPQEKDLRLNLTIPAPAAKEVYYKVSASGLPRSGKSGIVRATR